MASLEPVRAAYDAKDVAASAEAHAAKASAGADAPREPGSKEDHGGSSADYIKSVVFGGLDGIITTFAIVASVQGAQQVRGGEGDTAGGQGPRLALTLPPSNARGPRLALTLPPSRALWVTAGAQEPRLALTLPPSRSRALRRPAAAAAAAPASPSTSC